MLANLIILLQYDFHRWRAESLIQKANAAGGTPKHTKLLMKATEATLAVELLQRRFSHVTDNVDIRRNEKALRAATRN